MRGHEGSQCYVLLCDMVSALNTLTFSPFLYAHLNTRTILSQAIMARPTTEFAVLSLVPGANLVDPDSEGSRTWRDCLKTLSSFEGFRSSLYSVDEKDTNTMVEIVGKNVL